MTLTPAILNNVRLVEDTTWLFLFVVLLLTAARYAHASYGRVRKGYLTLWITGYAGLVWKGLGLVSRVFDLKKPELLFSVAREAFEGITGALFTAACVMLVLALREIYRDSKGGAHGPV